MKEVKINEPDTIPAEQIAEAILKISKAWERIAKSALKRETIIILLHAASKVPKRDIEYVLNSLDNLKAMYLKKDTK